MKSRGQYSTFIVIKSSRNRGSACIHPGCLWVLRHHEHEVEIDQVCAAADADDAALQVCLRLSTGLK